jgi:hypothetical protein
LYSRRLKIKQEQANLLREEELRLLQSKELDLKLKHEQANLLREEELRLLQSKKLENRILDKTEERLLQVQSQRCRIFREEGRIGNLFISLAITRL